MDSQRLKEAQNTAAMLTTFQVSTVTHSFSNSTTVFVKPTLASSPIVLSLPHSLFVLPPSLSFSIFSRSFLSLPLYPIIFVFTGS